MTKEQAVQKLRHYCAYQERCHSEAKEKLYELGISKTDHDEIIASLIEDNYLDEERFAIQFAGGKFRMNKWGKRKILYALKEKQVSEYSIKKALNQISEKEYGNVLCDLATKKYGLLNAEPFVLRKKKTIDYLLQKGFEPELVSTCVNILSEN